VAAGFGSAMATSTTGRDTAALDAAPGVPTQFVAFPAYSFLRTTVTQKVVQLAVGFQTVTGVASSRNSDTTYFQPGPGTTFWGTPAITALSVGSTVTHLALGWKAAVATAPPGGGGDIAELSDAAGSNTFWATPAYSYFVTAESVNSAIGFPNVVADAVG